MMGTLEERLTRSSEIPGGGQTTTAPGPARIDGQERNGIRAFASSNRERAIEDEHVRPGRQTKGPPERRLTRRTDDHGDVCVRERTRADESFVPHVFERVARRHDARGWQRDAIAMSNEGDVDAKTRELLGDRDGDPRLARSAERRATDTDERDVLGHDGGASQTACCKRRHDRRHRACSDAVEAPALECMRNRVSQRDGPVGSHDRTVASRSLLVSAADLLVLDALS